MIRPQQNDFAATATVSSKENERAELERLTEEFLAKGKTIKHLPAAPCIEKRYSYAGSRKLVQ